jgi:YfiR/HmsC-like
MRDADGQQRTKDALLEGSVRGLRIMLAVLVMLPQFSRAWPASAQASSPNEYAVKAAFLFHFAQFVEWPEGAFQNANSPVVYCTMGEDPFQGALDESFKGKTIDARVLQVRHLKEGSEVQGCHVVFIGKTGKRSVTDELTSLGSSPVLTVGETEQFVKDNGMIAFCTEENKIRFAINLGAAERANLKISAKLLALAKTVIGKPKRD